MERLSDEHISLLVDIGRKTPLDLTAQKRRLIEALITAGFITPSRAADAELVPYGLTAKAWRLLSEHATGLNEV